MNNTDKPRIRVFQNKHSPSFISGKVPEKWLLGNQFRSTILWCWLDFLDKNENRKSGDV